MYRTKISLTSGYCTQVITEETTQRKTKILIYINLRIYEINDKSNTHTNQTKLKKKHRYFYKRNIDCYNKINSLRLHITKIDIENRYVIT